MNKFLLFIILGAMGLPLFAQVDIFRLAPGAEEQLAGLLNKPAMVKPAVAAPLGKNRFTLETDAHVFTDQVSVIQVAEALFDLASYPKNFDGKLGKVLTRIISRGENELTVEYTPISVISLGIQIKTPYLSTVKILEYSDKRFCMEFRQLPQDTESNKKIKNLYAPRYAQEVTINGKVYTYIRIYGMEDVDASILPGARGTLERNAGPTNIEALLLLIEAAKKY
ncbi:MAG: hypothetical protein LBH44_02300 [Treponema sp.]|jgi:hypothetical protein|nr:hypothetical protein [Treponema sp.]